MSDAAPEVKISAAEWRVMEVLWEAGELTPAQVIKQLETTTDWNHRTIRSLLARLVAKGAASHSKSTGTNLYHAGLSREACIGKETESFVDRVFQGDVGSLIEHVDATPASASAPGAKRGTNVLGQVIDTFFGGSVGNALAAHLGRAEELSPKELERLGTLIESAKQKNSGQQ